LTYARPDLPQSSKPYLAAAAAKQTESIAASITTLRLCEPPRMAVEANVYKPPGSAEIAVVDDGSACGLDKIKSALDAGLCAHDSRKLGRDRSR